VGRVLELEGVVKRYGRGPTVLDGVDLRVAAGEVVQVAGANGAGKTTLLRVAVGLTRPTRGRVVRAGRAGWAPAALQEPPRLSARELLRALSVAPGEIAMLAERLAFAPWLDERLAHDSTGTLHKVVLAQALAGRPALIALDEPWSGLDDAARDALATLLREAGHAGAAILLSQHGAGPLAPDRTLEVRDGALRDAHPGQASIEVRGSAESVAALAADARARGLEVRER
jgi:ABC-type multidrug transport system ATPase subunit